MSDNLKDAADSGFRIYGEKIQAPFSNEDLTDLLEAYKLRILASQQAAHAAEIASLKAELTASDAALRESRANDMESMRQLSAANALIAMQAEALKRASISLGSFCSDEGWGLADMDTMDCVDATISTSAESVAAWESKKLLPLQRQVAMLHSVIRPFEHSAAVIFASGGYVGMKEWADKLQKSMCDTQATAEAYDREHAAKVLEEAARDRRIHFIAACNLRTMAEELRAAAKKGEVK